jgi:hypothetical protein
MRFWLSTLQFFLASMHSHRYQYCTGTWVLTVIVGSLSGSRLKSVRFLVGESSEVMTSSEVVKIIKINH